MSIETLFSLAGKTALVTGASSGIGLHVAKLYAQAGAKVALAARRRDRIDLEVAKLRQEGRSAIGLQLDVTKVESIAAAFHALDTQWPEGIDVLYNNSGVIYQKAFLDQEEAELDRVFDTNLKGAMLVAQQAARRMALDNGGAIINVASTAGLRAGGTLSSYGASKAALIKLTEIMALELASKGIRVNAICPGNIETDMQESLKQFEQAMIKRTPMRRFGKSEDLDGVSLLLASDAGRYMTGVSIAVDGGQSLSWM